jgi:chromosome segregation ATPase
MCKKIGIAAIAVVLGLVVLNKTKLGDWAKFGYQRAKDAISSSIPPEMEIAKLKSELANIGPKVNAHLNKMAEFKTSMDTLSDDIKEHTARLDAQRTQVLALREKVDDVKVKNGKAGDENKKLERAWKAYRTSEESLKAKNARLEARKERFEAAKQQLDSMKNMREQLASQIEILEARLEKIRVEETEQQLCFDDEVLGGVKEGLAELNKKISTMENFEELKGRFGHLGTTPTQAGESKTISEDLLNEIDAHLKPAKGGSKVAADRE